MNLDIRGLAGGHMRYGLLIVVALGGFSTVPAAGQNAVLLAPSSQGDGRGSAVDALKSGMAGRGVTVVEIPADEAGIEQAAALGDGAPVIVADPATGGYRVYDGRTGAEVTKKFDAGLSSEREKTGPSTVPEPERPKAAGPVSRPRPGRPAAFKKNHIGLSAGMSNLKKNEDSFNVLAANNSGAQVTHTRTTGRFRLFYEHYFSGKYGIGLAAGTGMGGQAVYDAGGRTLNIETDPKTGTLYFLRRFGRHFGIYLGGGADMYSFELEDPSNLAGVPAGAGNFKGSMVAPHGEAGLVFSVGNFSLRFSLKQTLGEGTDELIRNLNGADYRLIVSNNNALSYKTSGQALLSNERYFKADPGGFASAVTISYSFANW